MMASKEYLRRIGATAANFVCYLRLFIQVIKTSDSKNYNTDFCSLDQNQSVRLVVISQSSPTSRNLTRVNSNLY